MFLSKAAGLLEQGNKTGKKAGFLKTVCMNARVCLGAVLPLNLPITDARCAPISL